MSEGSGVFCSWAWAAAPNASAKIAAARGIDCLRLLVMKAVYSAALIKVLSIGGALFNPSHDILPLPIQRIMQRTEWTPRRQSVQFDVG